MAAARLFSVLTAPIRLAIYLLRLVVGIILWICGTRPFLLAPAALFIIPAVYNQNVPAAAFYSALALMLGLHFVGRKSAKSILPGWPKRTPRMVLPAMPAAA